MKSKGMEPGPHFARRTTGMELARTKLMKKPTGSIGSVLALMFAMERVAPRMQHTTIVAVITLSKVLKHLKLLTLLLLLPLASLLPPSASLLPPLLLSLEAWNQQSVSRKLLQS
jgi:hypothetical protein